MNIIDRYGQFVEDTGERVIKFGKAKWLFLPVMLLMLAPLALFSWFMACLEMMLD